MTTQTEHSPFPSDETLAAYIDGRLDEETRKRVVEHIADCAECLDVVQVNQELSSAPAAQVIHWPRNALVGLAAAAAVAAVVLLTPVRDVVWPRDDIKALAAVAPPERKIDGRLTGFPYQHLNRPRGGDESNKESGNELNLDNYKFYAVASDVEKRALEHPNARTLHAQGVAYLGSGDPKDVPKALQTLQEAQRLSPSSDPQLLSDLAAAYLATGDYEAAWKTANQAWALAKTPEIAWNRAIAAQRLHRRNEAIAAWNDYLHINDSPKWADEARRNLELVQQGY